MARRKLGRGVAIVGAGMSKFGSFADKTARDIFLEAYLEMIQSVDKGFDPRDIQALYIGNFSGDLFEGQGHLAPLIADWTGLVPRPATRVEGACASGGSALRCAIMAVASGLYDIVLVGGVEKMTALPTERVTDILAAAGDTLYEAPAGFTFPGVFAAIATAYMDKYGATQEHLMKVGIKNHNNGALNPKAQFNASIRDIMNSRLERARQKGQPLPSWKDEFDFLNDPTANPVVAWPLRLFDCSPISDGAACVLVVSEEIARNFTDRPIFIIGSGQGSDSPLYRWGELTSISATREAAAQAYEMAGVTPQDINIAEVHDCFTIAEIVATEDLGFFEPGRGAAAVVEGVTSREGPKPINTSGGLKSKGHPVGATGVAQAVEIWLQLRGQAGPRQVPGEPRLGLTHNIGGSGGTVVVHIYERR